MWTTDPSGESDDLTCPVCGLACDDLRVIHDPAGHPRLTNGCHDAQAAFTHAIDTQSVTPRIQGHPVEIEQALACAAKHLREAEAPLFAGLATDVNGMRAVLELADRRGAVLDHVNGDALFRNLLVQQDSGWMTTTLTEARNRADLVLVIGTQCLERFPRLVERVLRPPEAMFCDLAERELILIGPWGEVPEALQGVRTHVIKVQRDQLAGLAGLIRGLIAQRPVRTDALLGVSGEQMGWLAERLRAARYSVVLWSAAEFDFPHAELTIQALAELVRDLNETTRSAALPLGGTLGDITASQVCTWQTGHPLRTALRQGGPHYDPMLHRHADLLAREECDLLLWIAALPSRSAPPSTDRPTLVLGHPGLPLERTPEVFIPVGIPGIDHPGHIYRSDAVCPLPLGQVRTLGLPSVAEVLGQLAASI